jgi:hypothetical protein
MIAPTIWEDPSFNKLSVGARLMFIGIISNADDYGYIRGDLGSLKRLIFGFDEALNADILGWAKELQSFKNIHFYDVDGETYAHLLKWEEYQKQQADRKQPSTYPMCSKCVAGAKQVLSTSEASDEQVPTKGKVGKDKESKNKASIEKGVVVSSETTPRQKFKSQQFQQSYEFFNDTEKQAQVVADIIAKGLKEPYVKKEIQAFVDYWTAETKSGVPKWEKQETFMLRGRLATWFKNQFKWEVEPRAGRLPSSTPKGKNYG